jgi:hypothetical protein
MQKEMTKVVGRKAGAIGARQVVSGGFEASEEFFQELNNKLWGNLAAYVDENPNASTPMKAILKQSFDAMKAAIGPSLVLGAIPGAVGGVQAIKKEDATTNLKAFYEKAGYKPEHVEKLMAASGDREARLKVINEIEQEVQGADIEAGTEILPTGEEGTQAEAAAVEPTAPTEVHPQQGRADVLAERLKRPEQLTAVDPPDEAQHAATQEAAEALGFDEVVWVENKSDLPFGATTDEGVLYVATDVDRPGATAALHEAIEVVGKENPAELTTLVELVQSTARKSATDAQLARIEDSIKKLNADAPTELTVQILQEFAGDKDFWTELQSQAQADPAKASAVKRVLAKILEFIDNLMAKTKGSDRLTEYFKTSDLPKVRTALVNALNRVEAVEEVAVPDFADTDAALEFGEEYFGNEEVIAATREKLAALVAERDELERQSKAKPEDMELAQKWADKAVQAQLPREALEVMTGEVIDKPLVREAQERARKRAEKPKPDAGEAKPAPAVSQPVEPAKAVVEPPVAPEAAPVTPEPTPEPPAAPAEPAEKPFRVKLTPKRRDEIAYRLQNVLESDFAEADKATAREIQEILAAVKRGGTFDFTRQQLELLQGEVENAADVLEDQAEYEAAVRPFARSLRSLSDQMKTMLAEEISPQPTVKPTPTTPTPTEQAVEPEVGAPTVPVINETANQIDAMSYKDRRAVAKSMGIKGLGSNPTSEELRVALRQARTAYLDSIGQTERKPTTPSKTPRPTAADRRAQQAQEAELMSAVEGGTMTTEAAANTEGVTTKFKKMMQEYGTSPETPRQVGNALGWRHPDTGAIYGIRQDGASVRMNKKKPFAKAFVQYENGTYDDLSDVPFMAKEVVIVPDGPKSLVELEAMMRTSSPTLITRAKARALGTLVKGVAAYKGMSADEYVRAEYGGVIQGGVPGANALLKRDLRNRTDVNEQQMADHLDERNGQEDFESYMNSALAFINAAGKAPTEVRMGHKNRKVMLSIDFDTNCPFKDMNNECAYCYVAAPRIIEEHMGEKTGAKKEVFEAVELTPALVREFIENMPDALVQFMNENMGGMRVHSFSDYRAENAPLYNAMFTAGAKKGLNFKVITKQKEFVDNYKSRPNVFINISVDTDPAFFSAYKNPDVRAVLEDARGNVSNTPTLAEAKKWAGKQFKKNVNIRYIPMNRAEAIMASIDPDIAVVTMYHGRVRDKLFDIWKAQNNKRFQTLGPDFMRAYANEFQSTKPTTFTGKISQKELDGLFEDEVTEEAFAEDARSKFCCETGKCGTCRVDCGFGTDDVNTTLGKMMDGDIKASVEFDSSSKAIIRAFEATNVADMAHELGHIFRRDLSPADLVIAEQWAGVPDGHWTVEAEEKFALGFEKYLSEGKAPSRSLTGVFRKFKAWLKDIYGSIKGSQIDVDLTDEMRELMDRLVGQESTPPAPIPFMAKEKPATDAVSEAEGYMKKRSKNLLVKVRDDSDEATENIEADFLLASDDGDTFAVTRDAETGEWRLESIYDSDVATTTTGPIRNRDALLRLADEMAEIRSRIATAAKDAVIEVEKSGRTLTPSEQAQRDNIWDISANPDLTPAEKDHQIIEAVKNFAPAPFFLTYSQQPTGIYGYSFMAKEQDDSFENEINEQSLKRGAVRRPDRAGAEESSRGYPRALQHLKTASESELTAPQVVSRIQSALAADPASFQAGYTMERLVEKARSWISEQGGLFDAYNAVGTDVYSKLALNERIAVVQTLMQYLGAMGYQTDQDTYFDAALDLHKAAGEAGVELGRGVKAFDFWRQLAPNNAAEAVIFARRVAQDANVKALEAKGRDDVLGLVRAANVEAQESAMQAAIDRQAQLERERDLSRQELETITSSWRKARRDLFKSGNVPSQELVDEANAEADAAIEFLRSRKAPDAAFMARERVMPEGDVYEALVGVAKSRVASALVEGKSMDQTQLDIMEELQTLAPEAAAYFPTIVDQASAVMAQKMQADSKRKTRPSTRTQPTPQQIDADLAAETLVEDQPELGEARDTDPSVWQQNILDATNATLDEIINEVMAIRREGTKAAAAEAQEKAMERLQELADEQDITLAEAQAIWFQRAKERRVEDLFEWAANNISPIAVQERIERDSLLNWGRVNGMPDAEINLASSSDNMLGELQQWAEDNDIISAEEVPFAEGYENMDAGLTAASLKGRPEQKRSKRTPEQQRIAEINSQGRLAYELKQIDKKETGKTRAIKNILNDLIRQPFQRGRAVVEQLQERIIDKGWPPKDAERLAKEIAASYADLVDKSIRRNLTRKFAEKDVKRGLEDGKAIEDIIMLARTQMLTDQGILREFAKQYGLADPTTENYKEIERLGAEIERKGKMTDDMNSGLVRDAQADLNTYLYSLKKTNFWDLLFSFRKEAMLSGFTTTIQNAVSTSVQQMVTLQNTILKEMLRGNWGDVSIMLRGAMEPLKGEAWREFYRIVRDKRQPWKSGHKFDTGFQTDPTQWHPMFTKGGIKNPLFWFTHVFAWMQAGDYPFYLMNEGAAAALQTAKELQKNPSLKGIPLQRAVARKMGWGNNINKLMTQARNEGFTGREQRQRAYELRRDQWSVEAQHKGHELGNIGTFNVAAVPGFLGDIARAITGMKKQEGLTGRLVDVILPFVNIPFSVGNAVIANSPLGYIRALHTGDTYDAVTGKKRKPTGDERLGWTIQATQGSMILATGLFFFLNKWKKWKEDEDKDELPDIRITAHGPADSAQRAKWYAAGNEPYTITVNGKVYSYRAWSSSLGILAPMGAMMDMLLYGESDDPTKQKNFNYRVAMNSLMAMPQSVIDQTSLMQISALLEALEGAKAKTADVTTSKLNSIFARTVTSPIPNIFRQIENIWDPSIYDNKTLGAAFLQNVPFAASSRLNKRLNMFGEEITHSKMRQFYQLPVPRQEWDADPVAQWLVANDIPMGLPQMEKIEKDPRTGKYLPRSLDEEEKYRFLKIWGPMVREQLERRIPNYKKSTKKAIEKDIRKWRLAVKKRAWYEWQLAEDAR